MAWYDAWNKIMPQFLDVPKSKDPYTAATKGSSFEWLKPYAKPAALLPLAGSVLGTAVAGPGVGATIGTGIGAIQGKSTGIWGKPGWGSAVSGGLQGLAQSGIGSMIGSAGATGGFNTAANWMRGGSSSLPSMTGMAPSGQTVTYNPNYNPATQPFGIGKSSNINMGVFPVDTSGWNLGATPGSYTNPSAGWIPGATQGAGQEAAKGFFGSKAGQYATGAALALAPSMWQQNIKVPQSPYFGEYTSRLMQGTPMGQFGREGMQKLGEDWKKPEFAPLSEDMYSASVRKNEEEEKRAEEALRTEYKGIRPGANLESDSGFRKSLMEQRERFKNERSAMRTELDFNREQEYLNRLDNYYGQKMNYFNTVLGLDQNTVQQYAQLAQMDTERLMAETGLQAGEASRFQELFGDIGKMFIMKGAGLTYGDMLGQFGMGRAS